MKFAYWTVDELTEACLEALATGCIEGVPLEADPEDLASRLGFPDRRPPGDQGAGDPYGRAFEQRYFLAGRHMTRDWECVTAFYSREDLHAPWECFAITIRAYLMDEPPEWSALEAELRRHGYEVLPQADPDQYTVAASAVTAKVSAGGRFSAAPAGRLIEVTIGWIVVPPAAPARRGHLRNAMRALGREDPEARSRRVAEQGLGADAFVAVFTALTRLKFDQPDRGDEWTRLLSWFVGQARDREVFRPEEWVYHWARYGSPPPAQVSRACLDALPMTLGEALSMPDTWRDTGPDTARRARMTRALLRLAADAEPDEAAVRELTRWRTAKRSWIR